MDCTYLFDTWLDSVKRYKDNQRFCALDQGTRPSPLSEEVMGSERIGVAPREDMGNILKY